MQLPVLAATTARKPRLLRTPSAAQRPKPAMTQQNAAKSAATAQKLALTLLAAETARRLSKESPRDLLHSEQM